MRFLAIRSRAYLCFLLVSGSPHSGVAIAQPPVQMRVEEVHSWRPPFGLERVGQSRAVVVESPHVLPTGQLTIAASLAGRELARQAVNLPDKPPRVARVWFDGLSNFDELTL